MLSVLLAFVGALLGSGPLTRGERFLETSSRLPFTIVAGGALGAVEGAILALPQAAVLGWFRAAG